MRCVTAASLLMWGCLVAVPAVAIADVSGGCADCHGGKGIAARQDVPTIAGMSSFYLEGEMLSYQKGTRSCATVKGTSGKSTDMCTIAKGMSADQIKQVSAGFAGQTFAPMQQPTTAALVAKGKAIHEASCEICHSDGGSVADDDAGVLAGQPLDYLEATLKEYKAGKRIMPDKMKPVIAKLGDTDIEALAQFYAAGGK